MPTQGSYPMNGRVLALTDTLTGVVTQGTADVPVSALVALILGGGAAQGSGPTTNRPPSPAFIGQQYFDTTLGFMVWASQLVPATWVNAAGVIS